jgi:hypothetical protein
VKAIVAAGLVVAPALAPAFAQNNPDPNGNVAPFDFSNDFYNKNGLDIVKIQQAPGNPRVGFDTGGTQGSVENGAPPAPLVVPNTGVSVPGNWIVDNSNTDPTRTNVRVLQTTGGFDKDGNLIYYDIFGAVPDDTFFESDSGFTGSPLQCPTDFPNCATRANMLANEFRAFINVKQFLTKNGVTQLVFPDASVCNTVDTTTGSGPNGPHPEAIVVDINCVKNSLPIKFAPPPPNRRQDNVFDTQPTYFCQNLLGLWILTMTAYTPQAYLPNRQPGMPAQYASAAAMAAIDPIAKANGLTVDGTAVLERTSEIDSLTSQGFLQQFVLPRTSLNLSGPPRYVI